MIRAEHAQRVGALQLRHGAHHGRLQIAAVAVLQQMHDDLRVRLALKGVALLDQCLAQRGEVFDDAVVHHGKAAVV